MPNILQKILMTGGDSVVDPIIAPPATTTGQTSLQAQQQKAGAPVIGTPTLAQQAQVQQQKTVQIPEKVAPVAPPKLLTPAQQAKATGHDITIKEPSGWTTVWSPSGNVVRFSPSGQTVRVASYDIPSQRYESGMRPISTYKSPSSPSGAGYYAPGTPGATPSKAPTEPVISAPPTGRILSPVEAAKLGAAPVGSVVDVAKAVSSGAVPGFKLETPKGTEYFLTQKAAESRAAELSKPVALPALPPSSRMPDYYPGISKFAGKQTPIDTSKIGQKQILKVPVKTDIEKATLFPLYEASQRFTKTASELGGKYVVPYVKYTPAGILAPTESEQFVKGVVGGVASVPELVATTGLGYELIGRDILTGKLDTGRIATGIGLTAASLKTSALTDPYGTLGQFAGQGLIFGGIERISSSVKIPDIAKLTDIKAKPSFVEPTPRPVLEEISGLKTKAERLQEIKTEQFREAFKPESPLGRTTELQGLIGLKTLETKGEALSRIQAEEIKAAIKPEETPLGKSTEIPSGGTVLDSLKGLGTKDDRIAYLDAQLSVKPKPTTISYVPEAPATNVPESLRSLFGEAPKTPSIEARTLREIPSGGVVPEGMKGLMTKEQRLAYLREQLKERGLKTQAEAMKEAIKPNFWDIETSEKIVYTREVPSSGVVIPELREMRYLPKAKTGVQKFWESEAAEVSLKPKTEVEKLQERYKKAIEEAEKPISERGVMGIKFGSKGYAPGEKPVSGLISEYYTKHGTAEDLVSLEPKVKITPKPTPKVEVSEAKWETEMRRRGAEIYKDQPITIFGKEEPTPLPKLKLAEPKVEVRKVATAERPKPTVKELYTKEELGIFEKPKVEVKPSEPKVFVKRDIGAELKQKWAERNLSLEAESKGRTILTPSGQVLITRKPEQVQKVRTVQVPEIVDLTKLVPTTDISTFTGVKTVPVEKTKTVTAIKPVTKPVTKTTVRPIVEPIVEPIPEPITRLAPSPAPLKFPRPFMDIYWDEGLQQEIIVPKGMEKKEEEPRKGKKPKIQYKAKIIKHEVSELPDQLFGGFNVAPTMTHEKRTKPKPKKAPRKGKKSSKKTQEFWEF